jgi:dTDP-4-dehydrorhamnose reductase
MVGQAVRYAVAERGDVAVAAARSGADLALDVADLTAVAAAVDEVAPDLIVNCAAIVSIDGCERDPGTAYRVNARAVAALADAALASGARLVQVSTDHYWAGDGRAKHDERARVRLLNEYARSKYAGEAFALAHPDALVVRTNVTGFRGVDGRPTFIEWAIRAIEQDEPMQLFDDFYTSTIDAPALAGAILDLAAAERAGLVNVASSQVASKQEFVEALARRLGRGDREFDTASVRSIDPPRPDSLGLDVSAAERALGRSLPDLDAAVDALVTQREGVA